MSSYHLIGKKNEIRWKNGIRGIKKKNDSVDYMFIIFFFKLCC